jgi:hypothetical protein
VLVASVAAASISAEQPFTIEATGATDLSDILLSAGSPVRS